MPEKETVILFHGGCPDGLGGAYAAWKKFGDTAEYIPVKHGLPPPEGLAGRKLFVIDFSYPKAEMDALAASAVSLVVLDHHLGAKETVESMSTYVFDEHRSGATIAWNYFHPDTPVPLLLKYIEDGDLYQFKLPNAREILAYFYTSPLLTAPLSQWDEFVQMLEDPAQLKSVIQVGGYFEQYHAHIVEDAVHHAELVEFEGFECLLTGALGEFISDTGHQLSVKHPPVGIVISADANRLRVSLRSDGTVDVAALARKYGGNGHPAAAGFRIPLGNPVPWKVVEKEHEGPVH